MAAITGIDYDSGGASGGDIDVGGLAEGTAC